MEGWRGGTGHVARIGALSTDSHDEALRKETLVLFTSFTALVSFAWVGMYLALGLYTSAAIPFAYQVVCVANLVVFAKTKRYRFFRTSALALGLVLPFLLQVSLGGFLPSSGIVLWSFTAPLGALLFASRGDATRWFGAFVGVIGLSAVLEPFLTPVEIPHRTVIAFFALNILGVTAMTSGAADVVERHAPDAVRADILDRLTSADPDRAWEGRHVPHRAPGRQRRRRQHHPAPCRTATSGCCTARSTSAPTSTPTSSSCSPDPRGHRPAAGGSPRSSSPATRPTAPPTGSTSSG